MERNTEESSSHEDVFPNTPPAASYCHERMSYSERSNFPSLHEYEPNDVPTIGTTTVSRHFVDALHKPCPMCGDTHLVPSEFESATDATSAELVLNFNLYHTAIINTAAEGLARLLNKADLRDNIGAAVIELCRLFLKTDPVMLSGYWDKRKSRGYKNNTKWVGVLDNNTSDPAMGDMSDDTHENASTPDATQAVPPDDGSQVMYEDVKGGGMYAADGEDE